MKRDKERSTMDRGGGMLSYNALNIVHTYGQVLVELYQSDVQEKKQFLVQCAELKKLCSEAIESLGSAQVQSQAVIQPIMKA